MSCKRAAEFGRGSIMFRAFSLGVVTFLIAIASISETALGEKRSGRAYIHDPEIESLVKAYVYSILSAAKIDAQDEQNIDVHLLDESSYILFMPNKNNIFISRKVISRTSYPNSLKGLIAHEISHIVNGHLKKIREATAYVNNKNDIRNVVNKLLVDEKNAKSEDKPSALLGGNSSPALRIFYRRSEEARADKETVKILNRAGLSSRGFLKMLEIFKESTLKNSQSYEPYVSWHPNPIRRIEHLRSLASQSEFFNKDDPPSVKLRYDLVQKKLSVYFRPKEEIKRFNPQSDTSQPARYARALLNFLDNRCQESLDEVNELIDQNPNYASFWELKAKCQKDPVDSSKLLRKALSVEPDREDIRIDLAQSLIFSGNERRINEGLDLISEVLDGSQSRQIRSLLQETRRNYQRGNPGEGHLLVARAFDNKAHTAASRWARFAQNRLKRGSPLWRAAQDLIAKYPNWGRQQMRNGAP